jgi:RNA polymerase sigma factor (sigma-70 family)
MKGDTEMGGALIEFPATRCSLIFAAGSPDSQTRKLAFGALVAGYWKPIYKYIRLKWGLGNEDAKDLTQEFFARALEKGFVTDYDPAKARFRTYLRVCVDRFVANQRKSAGRIKRGGNVQFLNLDFATADGEMGNAPCSVEPEEFFEREWVRSLFAMAVEDLRRQCEEAGKKIQFVLFERYDLDNAEASRSLTYSDLGREFGLPTTQVTNYLAWARREFRQLLLQRLRSATGNEEEFQAEARRLLGGNFS